MEKEKEFTEPILAGHIMILASFQNQMESMCKHIDELKKRSLMINDDEGIKECIKYAKMCKTFGDKAIDGFKKNLNPLTTLYIGTEASKREVVFRFKKSATAEWKQQRKMDEFKNVHAHDLGILVELGKASCSVCESVGDEVRECPARKTYIKLGAGIENLDADPDKGGCQFRVGVISDESV